MVYSRLSDTAENSALGLLMGGTSWTLTNKYLGHATAALTDTTTGSTVTEPGGSYARISTSGADWNSAASRAVINSAQKDFALATTSYTASWSFQADALTAGNIIWYDELAISQSISANASTPSLAASSLTLTLHSAHLSDDAVHSILDHIVGNATFTPAATYYFALNRRPTKLGDVTANASTEELSLTSHGLSDGDAVTFTTTNTLPAGLSTGTRYFVHSSAANTFQVRTISTDSTTNINITDTGTGTHSVHRAGNLDGAYIYEADYGTSGRQSKTNNTTNFPAPSAGATDNGTSISWAASNWDGGTDELAEIAIWDADIGTGSTVTFTNSTNLVNETTHGLTAGTKIIFRNSGGALPAELESNRVYFVINANANDFQVSETSGGSAVTFTDDGTGTSQRHTTGELVWVGELTNSVTPSANSTISAATSSVTFTFT